MADSISTKDELALLAKNVPSALYGVISGLVAVNPVWSVLFITAIGLINVWGDFGQARVNELVEEIDKHKGEFNPEVLATDKFKSVFLNVLEAHVQETMGSKRQLYRNYLINVGKGVYVDFDYHSKLLTVLNLITFEEIHALEALIAGYDNIVGDFARTPHLPAPKPTTYEISVTLEHIGKPYPGGLPALGRDIRALYNYNLILTSDATNSETGAVSPRVEEIPRFCRVFLAFIAEPQ